MKQKKIVLKRMSNDVKTGKPNYKVEKTFNLMEPVVGEVLTSSEAEQYVQSRVIEVEIK
jgi:hypothetical protein